MLKLLAKGHTDETIAKRVGVSSRTVRRIAADLMDKMDARSRFQAGAQAALRGMDHPGRRDVDGLTRPAPRPGRAEDPLGAARPLARSTAVPACGLDCL